MHHDQNPGKVSASWPRLNSSCMMHHDQNPGKVSASWPRLNSSTCLERNNCNTIQLPITALSQSSKQKSSLWMSYFSAQFYCLPVHNCGLSLKRANSISFVSFWVGLKRTAYDAEWSFFISFFSSKFNIVFSICSKKYMNLLRLTLYMCLIKVYFSLKDILQLSVKLKFENSWNFSCVKYH